MIVGQRGLVGRFFAHEADGDIQRRCDAGSKDGRIQFRLRGELIRAFDEVGREGRIGNDEIPAGNDFDTLHILHALLDESESVREGEDAPIFLHGKDDDFITVVMCVLDKASVSQGERIAVHDDRTAVLPLPAAQKGTYAREIVLECICT